MAIEAFGPPLIDGDEVFGPNTLTVVVIDEVLDEVLDEVFGPMFIGGDEVFGGNYEEAIVYATTTAGIVSLNTKSKVLILRARVPMTMRCEQPLVWPCTYEGSNEVYGLALQDYLKSEGDAFQSIVWTLPNGLVGTNEVVVDDIAYIKIEAEFSGVHVIKYELESIESGSIQTRLGKIILTVQDLG